MLKIGDTIYCGDKWEKEKHNYLCFLSPNKKYKILDMKSEYLNILSDDGNKYWYIDKFFISEKEVRMIKLKKLKSNKWMKYLK
jgi:hypothetical protein